MTEKYIKVYKQVIASSRGKNALRYHSSQEPHIAPLVPVKTYESLLVPDKISHGAKKTIGVGKT
jgi:hypothetical protein